MASPMHRSLPNVLITGTPGTGKTLTATEVVQKLDGFEHKSVGDIAEIGQLYDGWDDRFQCHVLDEDRVGMAWANAADTSTCRLAIIRR